MSLEFTIWGYSKDQLEIKILSSTLYNDEHFLPNSEWSIKSFEENNMDGYNNVGVITTLTIKRNGR